MNIRLVGLGSANAGDDQVGLLAAARLRATLPPEIEVTTDTAGGARLVELGEGCHTLVLLDALAASSTWPVGTRARWRYPQDREILQGASFRGTHSISVVAGLELARALSRLPSRVLIHALATKDMTPGGSLSSGIRQPLERWIRVIHRDVMGLLGSIAS